MNVLISMLRHQQIILQSSIFRCIRCTLPQQFLNPRFRWFCATALLRTLDFVEGVMVYVDFDGLLEARIAEIVPASILSSVELNPLVNRIVIATNPALELHL